MACTMVLLVGLASDPIAPGLGVYPLSMRERGVRTAEGWSGCDWRKILEIQCSKKNKAHPKIAPK